MFRPSLVLARCTWLLWRLALLCACVISTTAIPSEQALVELPDGLAVKQLLHERMEPLGAIAVFFVQGPVPPVVRRLAKQEDVSSLFGAIAFAPVEAGVVSSPRWDEDGRYAGEGQERLCIFYRRVGQRGSTSLDPPVWRARRGPTPSGDSAVPWAEGPLLFWLREHAYPLVNVPMRGIFSGPKYVQWNIFGLVLVSTDQLPSADWSKGGPEGDSLLHELALWAKFYRRRLKFSLFTCVKNTREVCDRLGLTAGGLEVVIVEKPSELTPTRLHVGRAASLKHHLPASETAVPGGIRRFFERYSAGQLEPFYASAPPSGNDFSASSGVHELQGNEVAAFVAPRRSFPGSAETRPALLLFWSSEAQPGEDRRETEALFQAFEAVGHKRHLRSFARLGALDCAWNEHPLQVSAVPWVRFFANSGRVVEVEARRMEALVTFLEEQRAEQEEG